jgi:uncharacterized surface protein with fasciclin (FAS1) repeats
MFERPRDIASGAGSTGLTFLLGLATLGLVLTGCDDESGVTQPPEPNIVEVAQTQDNLSTLVSALDAAGLADDLQGDGPFTVFAPANAAFDAIDADELTGDQELLQEVLQYHVIAGQEITAGEISDGQTVETLEGESLTFGVENGTVTVNGATVTSANVQASNGVIHIVDGVLLETVTAVDRVVLTPEFSILQELVVDAGLASALSGPGPDGEDGLTIFGPTDDAFLAALDADGSGAVEDDEVPSNAGAILQYHVLDDVFAASDVPTTETDLPTLEGSDVTVVRSGSDVTVNPGDENASVVDADIDVSNGVIHAIDAVLTPPSN